MFKSDRNRYSLIFPLFFYSSRASEKAGRIYSCALRLNPHSAARRFQLSRTVFRISDAIAVASLVLISQYGAISSARSREIVASSSFTQRDSSSPSGTGFTSYRGERCQPSALRIKPWFLMWSSVLETAMLNTIRFHSSVKSFLGAAPLGGSIEVCLKDLSEAFRFLRR